MHVPWPGSEGRGAVWAPRPSAVRRQVCPGSPRSVRCTRAFALPSLGIGVKLQWHHGLAFLSNSLSLSSLCPWRTGLSVAPGGAFKQLPAGSAPATRYRHISGRKAPILSSVSGTSEAPTWDVLPVPLRSPSSCAPPESALVPSPPPPPPERPALPSRRLPVVT